MSEESKMLVATASLLVTRDPMTILPTIVPAHEVDVIYALHGQENVQVVDEPTAAVEIDASGEPERLKAKYGEGILEKAFGANFNPKILKAVKEAEVKAPVSKKAAA